MAFQLARHWLRFSTAHERATRAVSPLRSSIAGPLAAGEIPSAGAAVPSLLASVCQLMSLPGLSGPLPMASGPGAADANGPQQLKALHDTYDLMSGQGINVNVQNLDLQSRFAS